MVVKKKLPKVAEALLLRKLPRCPDGVNPMVRFSLASPFILLLTHSTDVLGRPFTVRTTVLLTVWLDTVVMIEYSVLFFNSGHSMAGKGNPSLTHTQVRTSDWTPHPEFFKMLENPVGTRAGS